MKLLQHILLFTFVALFGATNVYADFCSEVDENYNLLAKWVQDTKFDAHTKICPVDTEGSPFYNLNKWSGRDSYACRNRAAGSLIDFYAIFFQANPNYQACTFDPQPFLLAAHDMTYGQVCSDTPVGTVKDCFALWDMIIVYLKQFNQPEAAFTAANKIANSDDVTGLSQFLLGAYYYQGYGTNKNIPLAIHWLKVALSKTDNKDLQLGANTFLALSYQTLNNDKSAQFYLQQCTVLGDKDCKKEMTTLGLNTGA